MYLSITERTRESLQKNIRMVFPGFNSGLIDAAQSTATALMANMVSLIPYVPADVISSRMVSSITALTIHHIHHHHHHHHNHNLHHHRSSY